MTNYRTYDGTDNGGRNTGRAGRPLLDLGLQPVPFDPEAHPHPRRVTTRVCAGSSAIDPFGRAEMMWAWGQFLDHELDLVNTDDDQTLEITVPYDDPRVELRGTPTTFKRSRRENGELRNIHTAYVDAGNVYGPNDSLAGELRTGEDGLLRSRIGLGGEEWLPPGPGGFGFLAGDGRVNEHCVLISLHTLWLREHNRLCRVLASGYGVTGDEDLYQRARLLVGAQMQVITYTEFLPALLGPEEMPAWAGFRPEVDPGISNVFAAAAYRLGHSMVGDDLLLEAGARPLPLRDAFFSPQLVETAGIEAFLYGLGRRPMQAVDTIIVDGLREHLFAEPDVGRIELRDLAMLNIQRGRDHELPSYDEVRKHYGLDPVTSFADLTSNHALAQALTGLYQTPQTCDLWVALLAEDACASRRLGDLLTEILVDQFSRIRDGDHHWWEHDPNLESNERAWVGCRRLADVVRDNTAGLAVSSDLFTASG